MYRSVVDSYSAILPILITAFRTIIKGRQFQAFIPAMPKKGKIPMIFISFSKFYFFIMTSFILFFFKHLLIFLGTTFLTHLIFLFLPFLTVGSLCISPVLEVSRWSNWLFCRSYLFLIFWYSLADICLFESTALASLALLEVPWISLSRRNMQPYLPGKDDILYPYHL